MLKFILGIEKYYKYYYNLDDDVNIINEIIVSKRNKKLVITIGDEDIEIPIDINSQTIKKKGIRKFYFEKVNEINIKKAIEEFKHLSKKDFINVISNSSHYRKYFENYNFSNYYSQRSKI